MTFIFLAKQSTTLNSIIKSQNIFLSTVCLSCLFLRGCLYKPHKQRFFLFKLRVSCGIAYFNGSDLGESETLLQPHLVNLSGASQHSSVRSAMGSGAFQAGLTGRMGRGTQAPSPAFHVGLGMSPSKFSPLVAACCVGSLRRAMRPSSVTRTDFFSRPGSPLTPTPLLCPFSPGEWQQAHPIPVYSQSSGHRRMWPGHPSHHFPLFPGSGDAARSPAIQ